MTPGNAQELGIEQHAKGAVVTSVRDGSPAQEAGLQRGDVIIEVDRKPIVGADEAVSALTSKKAPMHLVRVRRQNEAVYITLPAA
jgi:serine protease Do